MRGAQISEFLGLRSWLVQFEKGEEISGDNPERPIASTESKD